MRPYKKITATFLVCLLIAIINGHLFIYLNNSFFHLHSTDNDLSKFSVISKFALTIILAPLIETFLFQYLPNIILVKLKITNRAWLIVLPAILFGCMHFYFWLYAVAAFFGGLILNFLYIYCKERSKYYFLIVVLFHSLYNLYGYIYGM